MKTAVIVPAFGRSSRMAGEDKLWAALGDEPLLARSLRAVSAFADQLIVAAPEPRHAAIKQLQSQAMVTEGGATRQDSVYAALQLVSGCDYVLVHDAARPLLPAEVIQRVLDATMAHGAAIPVIRLSDSVKEVNGENVRRTLRRDELRLVQTPQGFLTEILHQAHENAKAKGIQADDDSALVEALGRNVAVVAGDARNFKVTAPSDLQMARALIEVEV